MSEMVLPPVAARVPLAQVSEEPFRVFFPLAVLAGLAGVLLWPLHFGGWVSWYPALGHGRIMAHGFFGGFMIGFLGTAMPRMLSSRRFTGPEVGLLAFVHVAMVTAHATARTGLGDVLFLVLLGLLASSLGFRLLQRRDVPPPGFLMVGLALVSGAAGTVLALLQDRLEDQFFWLYLRPLLQFQGFVLFPILGVGGFILPRFFGLPSRQDFPESRTPPPGWAREAWIALAVGLAVLGSMVLEAAGGARLGSLVRCAVAAGFLYWQVPFLRSTVRGSSLARVLQVAFVLLPGGFLAIAVAGAHRVALLHLVLIGGFGLLTLAVATRVVFGHSGQRARLGGRLPWLTLAAVFMLAGMATRISGDYWLKILPTHYTYAALLWATGLLLWALRVLPHVRRPDAD